MPEHAQAPRVRRGLLIAGLAVVLLAAAGIVHFVVSGARADFPIQMITKGRSWLFIGGHALLGLVGLILLGLARPRARSGAPRPLEPAPPTSSSDAPEDKTDEEVDDEV